MSELYMQYEKNDQLYKLETYSDLIKITRNNKVIHVQFKRMATHDDLVEKGFKNLNDIIGNFSEYIDFCEESQFGNQISFEDDEWCKHTKIYAKIVYKDKEGNYFGIRRHVESVPGVMANSRTNKALAKYSSFIYGPNTDNDRNSEDSKPTEQPKQMTQQELLEYLNAIKRRDAKTKMYS
jgi:hypothetical protein